MDHRKTEHVNTGITFKTIAHTRIKDVGGNIKRKMKKKMLLIKLAATFVIKSLTPEVI